MRPEAVWWVQTLSEKAAMWSQSRHAAWREAGTVGLLVCGPAEVPGIEHVA